LFIRDAHNQHRPKKHRARRPLVHLFFLGRLSFPTLPLFRSFLLNSTGLGFSFFSFFSAAFFFSSLSLFFFLLLFFYFASLSLFFFFFVAFAFFFFGSEQTRSPVIFRGNERRDAWVRAKLKQRVHLRINRRPKLDEARKSLVVQRVHFFLFFSFFSFLFFLWVRVNPFFL
jgi:hypothetical protein